MNTTALCEQLACALLLRGWMLASAESCTGGLLAACCTEIPGSSRWFERGFVTYSNASKSQLLGVPEALIAMHGAVSEPVAHAMARGVLRNAPVALSVAVTGIAGPGGGSAAKPVGTVCFGWCIEDSVTTQSMLFEGNRTAIRYAAVEYALRGLIQRLV